ncbi:hypothetical protein [Lentilactobacillus sunkii]|uniref:Uncharacterized protein n=1 Tax=Lentilactobacillus sunkii DSM 19904 TaxID=1423808 RepID=A0A0R1L2U1_9LACO|nr:hypothetical protein [Lentilactobacillus sunkii]KRK88019.1 hypothetical protein FD17_GL000667 [Lentilactobacillus sunkii DSM 19904]
MTYLEKIAHIYIENQVNHKSGSAFFQIDPDQSNIKLNIEWWYFNLQLDKSYFVDVSMNRDGEEMLINEQMIPVEKMETDDPYLSMCASYAPELLKPKAGSYQFSVTLMDEDQNICDFIQSYFEIQVKEKTPKPTA